MIPLHVHSDYSILDSILQIPEYVKLAKAQGLPAVGLTDHGTIAGVVDLWTECEQAGIKPVMGCEFYHVRKLEDEGYDHLVLYARNRQGFANLVELCNRAQRQFRKRPRVLDSDVEELGAGLVGTSACIGGRLAKSVLAGKFDLTWYRRMKKALDGFWLEVHDNAIPEQYRVNEEFLKRGPCVAANDAHFLLESDELAHRVALAVQTRSTLAAAKFQFSGKGYWMRLDPNLPAETIRATEELAGMIERFEIRNEGWQVPPVEVDPDEELFRLEDALFRMDLRGKEYRQRLEYEFGVIKDAGLLPYFKVVASIYEHFAERKRFVGWGRGSTGGSLVAYLYGITKIDPIRWGLLFERFLNPGRITMPDIDMDFQPGDRAEAIEVLRRFGQVTQISTYGTFGTKEVIHSVSKAMERETGLSAFVPNEAPVPTVAELMKTKAFARQVSAEENGDMIAVCLRLEGVRKSASTHAAGVVLTSDHLPLRQSRSGVNKGAWSTEWDMYALEKLRYLKFDVLGVKNLETIDRVCDAVGIRPEGIPLEDSKTFELIRRCDTTGVFQWESDGYKTVVRRLQPDCFDHLLDLNTLYRPGCLESGITDEYIERRHGRHPVEQLHPKLNMTRYGLPLYQEDVILMARDLAGFTLAEADVLRKAIGKKEKESFAAIKQQFLAGCAAQSVLAADAERLWAMMEKSARYTWNRAHAVAYTLISWWTAWLSANHPTHFFCELLNQAEGTDRRRVLLAECRRRGIEVLAPDINKSELQFTVDGGIRFGLQGIKYVGDKALTAILDARDEHRDDCAMGLGGPCDCGHGPFDDAAELKKRSKVTKRVIEYLEMAGAFGGEVDPKLQRQALGYSLGERPIDSRWWYRSCPQIGEVIDIHKITTKRGDPMAFLLVDFRDRTESLTVFPELWAKIKDHAGVGTVALFRSRDDRILVTMCDPDEFRSLRVELSDVEGFLSFYPSLKGVPNVYAGELGVAAVVIDESMLRFMDEEFGIIRIFV